MYWRSNALRIECTECRITKGRMHWVPNAQLLQMRVEFFFFAFFSFFLVIDSRRRQFFFSFSMVLRGHLICTRPEFCNFNQRCMSMPNFLNYANFVYILYKRVSNKFSIYISNVYYLLRWLLFEIFQKTFKETLTSKQLQLKKLTSSLN